MGLAVAAAVAYSQHGGSSAPTVYTPLSAQAVQNQAAGLQNQCAESDLTSCLEVQPSNASVPTSAAPWGSSAGAVTVQQYVQAYYSDSAAAATTETTNLQTAGAQAVAHEEWASTGPDQSTIDLMVVRFASAQGAQARALAGQGDAQSPSESNGLAVSIPGLPGHVYPERTPDAEGYVHAEYYTAVGNLLMVAHFSSLSSFDQATFAPWALGEYLTLQTARIPSAPVATLPAATTACSPLSGCLVPVPAGDTAFTTGWGATSTATVSQFVQHEYASSYAPTATAQLETEGVTGIAPAMWQDSAGDQFEVDLLQFRTLQGAQARARVEIGAIKESKFSVSGPGAAEGGYATTADSEGFYDKNVYGSVGDVAVEVHTFAKTASGQSTAGSLAQQEFAKLSAVTTTSTVPQPAATVPSTAPSTLSGTSACTEAVSCLMSMPSGATARNATGYDNTVQVTPTEFAAAQFSSQSGTLQSYEADLLTERGVQQIVHRAWYGVNGDQADVVVMDFASAAEAQADAMDYQGAILDLGQRFSIAGYPDAVGEVDEQIDQFGNVYAQIVAYTAHFEVQVQYFSSGTFSPADAVSWFDTQMAELPAG